MLPIIMAYAIINGMTIKVDTAGRIVLPKQIRERLRIQSGATLSLEESAEGIWLRPIRRRTSLILKRGLLVHRGEAARGGEGPANFCECYFSFFVLTQPFLFSILTDLSGICTLL